MTAFYSVQVQENDDRHGIPVEQRTTSNLFIRPSDQRTEDYVTGRFG